MLKKRTVTKESLNELAKSIANSETTTMSLITDTEQRGYVGGGGSGIVWDTNGSTGIWTDTGWGNIAWSAGSEFFQGSMNIISDQVHAEVLRSLGDGYNIRLANVGGVIKLVGHALPVGVDLVLIGHGIHQDSGTFGNNAGTAAGSAVGGVAGAWATAKIGAKFGVVGGLKGVIIGTIGGFAVGLIGGQIASGIF